MLCPIAKRVASGCAIALFTIVSVSPASAIEMTPELRKIVDGAKAEGRLVTESAPGVFRGAAGINAATDWMKKEFGIDVRGSFTPNPSFRTLIAKIYTELQANQKASTDIFIGTPTQVQPMLDKGMFRPIPWQALLPGRITSEIAEADGKALRILTRMPAILYNKKLVPGMARVRSMKDLLKPEYRGKFAAPPHLGGFDVVIANWGYEATVEYIKAFKNQMSGLAECGSGERIASGEVLALVLDCSGTEQTQDRFKNILDLHIVPDAAQRRFNYLAVPTNATNPNAAILFGLWFSTLEGQAWQRDHGNGDLDTYPESAQRPLIDAAEKRGAKFVDADIEWAARNEKVLKQHTELLKHLR